MKPMGTITKYYPFIDEETKSILNSIMDESSNYYDFTQQLCEVALNNDVPVNLAYLAIMQAWWCRMRSTVKLLGERYGDVPYIKPWLHVIDSAERDQALSHDTVVESIDKALENSVDDWIEAELHILHAFFHHPFGEVISLFEPLEKVKALIDTHPHLDCFESVIYAFEGIAKTREEKTKDAIVILQKGKSLAELHNDALYLYMNMLQEGNILRCVSVHEAATVFEDLYELVQNLQVPGLVCEILNDSSLVYETTGEFDLTISSHHEVMKIVGDRHLVDSNFIILSRTYATLGDGQQSLEWINRGIEDNAQFASIHMLLYKAWALALVNRIDEAEQTLETAYSLLIKAGSESHLGEYYHFSGVVELKKGNFLDALDLFEKAWAIAERSPRIDNKTRVLLDLARVEILIDNQSIDRTKVALPRKWLSKLETHAFERDLLGIKMYAALLKSEFYQIHDQLKDAQAVLRDALDITDSPGVLTLRKKVAKRILEIDQLIQDEEIVS